MRAGAIALYAATAGGFAVAVRAVVFRPPPIDWALAGLGGYFALLACLVFVPQLGAFGDPVARVRAPGVAVTLDVLGDGSGVNEALAILAQRKVAATFFVRGDLAEKRPDLLRAMHAGGHEIGSLGQRKDPLLALRLLPTLTREIERSLDAIEAITKERPQLYRPPRGVTTPRIVQAAVDLGLVVATWTGRVADGSVLRLVTNREVGERLHALLDAIAGRQLAPRGLSELIAAEP